MRVFCPEHRRGFFTPRQNPIKCENKGHILGELDFAGETKAPIELQWQYCCNCEHFCPIDFDQNSLERCPVCTRRSSMLYLCDRCLTISFESDTPVQTKNFTLTLEGTPQPSCPGCLQATAVDVREHTCEVLGALFITALNSCPICRERLDLAPSFPSSVAQYLRKTRTANKFNLTFDYETELFVPVEDGEFVLISNGNGASESILLPRAERFATRRDFYDFYQDYYHCASPDKGEVNIIQPASVTPTVAGWKLQAPGMLEILRDQSEKKPLAGIRRPQLDTTAREAPALAIAAMREKSAVTACSNCGTLVETRYAFCWKCSNALTPANEPSITPSAAATHSAVEAAPDDEEQTVVHDERPVSSQIFSWASPKELERPTPRNSAMLKLIGIIVIGILIVSLGVFVLTRSDSRVASVTAVQPANTHVQSTPIKAPVPEVTGGVATETSPQRTSAVRPEVELKNLREKRIAATASDRSAISQTFATAENQYPNDYRFPYERAKLAMIGPQSGSHEEAFDALSLAAEKAIHTGKSHEMLDSLEADKAGDFHKLAHGHREWVRLVKALKDKDTKLLSGKQEL